MAKIEIYTKTTCPYCVHAKRLLESKGQSFEEINLMESPERTDEMVERAGGRTTVPEIFIDGKLIGGFDDLAALEQKGELDKLLA
ncbi:MAG: glutaredoxin 3 [Planctomycetota bacterium]|jgi:glutaredoxin 3|nr:glutaredoxin 3 [Planctomycetota bacterium]